MVSLLAALVVVAPQAPQEPALELSIAAGGELRSSSILGGPESTLVFCVEEVVRRWQGSAFASARSDVTLLIPLGVAAEQEARAKASANRRLALPWGFIQDLAGCRGMELLRNQPADCTTRWEPLPPCSPPLEADVALTVRSDGSVKSARVSSQAFPGSALPGTECLERAARRWRFPEFTGVAHQVGAHVLLAPGTPCSDPVPTDALGPQHDSTSFAFGPRHAVALIVLGIGAAVAVARWRRRR